MKTPAYFALGNFTANPVPVPGGLVLLDSSLIGLAGLRRKQRK